MSLSTTLSWVLLMMKLMTDYTLARRTQQLIAELELHPDREELLEIMQEQLMDDMFDYAYN